MSWRRAAFLGVAFIGLAACGAPASDEQAPYVQVAGVVETRSAVTVGLELPDIAASTSVAAPEATPPAPTEAPEASPAVTTFGGVDARERALALITYPWEARLPGWTIVFGSSRAGLRGLTFPDSKRIEIYVRSTDTPESLARVLAHELGHAVDLQLNDVADRQRWMQARGIEGARWWPDPSTADFDTGAGDFAEAFAVWQAGVATQSRLAGPPTSAQLELLRQLAQA